MSPSSMNSSSSDEVSSSHYFQIETRLLRRPSFHRLLRYSRHAMFPSFLDFTVSFFRFTLLIDVMRFISPEFQIRQRDCSPDLRGSGMDLTIPVFDTAFGKIGAAICWENRMPSLRTAMYAKGIEIYCAPTADARETWKASMTHIALEGGCFVLSANQFCLWKDYPPPPEFLFSGSEESLTPIISPLGVVLAGPNYEGEGLISADLNLGDIARAKFDFDVVGRYSEA
ncbi:unnamed protein product [Cochlearia groenlandica]